MLASISARCRSGSGFRWQQMAESSRALVGSVNGVVQEVGCQIGPRLDFVNAKSEVLVPLSRGSTLRHAGRPDTGLPVPAITLYYR